MPLGLLCAAFHLSLLLIGGLLVGFGRSSISLALQSTLPNLASVFPSLVAVELTRAYLLTALGRRQRGLMLAFMGLLFAFVSLPLARITSFRSEAAMVGFLGETGIPLLAENLLASYLALLGGPLPAIAYRGLLTAYQWLSPILPDLSWALKAFLGTVAPAVGYLAASSVLRKRISAATVIERPELQRRAAIGWVTASIIGVGVSWFALGLFPVYPVTVVSDSMAPSLDQGDLAILRRVTGDGVEVGDVIQYAGTDKYVLHRVVEATGSGANRVFTTKGDGNNVEDPEPATGRAVRGQLVFYISKLGYLGIAVKQLIGRASGAVSGNGLLLVLLLVVPGSLFGLRRLRTIWKRPEDQGARSFSQSALAHRYLPMVGRAPLGREKSYEKNMNPRLGINRIDPASGDRQKGFRKRPENLISAPLRREQGGGNRIISERVVDKSEAPEQSLLEVPRGMVSHAPANHTAAGFEHRRGRIQRIHMEALNGPIERMDQILRMGPATGNYWSPAGKHKNGLEGRSRPSSAAPLLRSSPSTFPLSVHQLLRWIEVDGRLKLQRALSPGTAIDLVLKGTRSEFRVVRGSSPKDEVVRGV